ncbi:IclR family transcriptional regulator [Rubrivivax gelatinosus]|nr:IclR family transcriptional regulator [Rubrivivax gelatinosus]
MKQSKDGMAADEAGGGERAGGVQVIARAAAVLRALRDHPDGLSLGELARLLGLARSTVQRIVEALDREQLVIAASPTRGVRLGPALLALAAAARFDVAEFARPVLQALARDSGETVDLSLLDGERLVFVEQVTGAQRLRAESGVGVAFPLHASAPGKAMLAALSAAELATLRPRLRLTALTPNTITGWPALQADLDAVRTRGWAVDQEENAAGICALAAALRLPGGEVAAISIPVPASRFDAVRDELAQRLLDRCSALRGTLRER